MATRSLKRRKKMDGLKLAAKYSYVCERAKLLKISETLRNFFQHNIGNEKIIENILKGLASFDFYQKIAHLNKKNIFDEEVVAFYWKGSPKLKGEEFIHNNSTLLPIIQLRMNQIVSELVDECVVHPARIVEKTHDDTKDYWVEYRPIVKTNRGLKLGEKSEIRAVNELNLELKEGDWIAIHFRRIIETISRKEAQHLKRLTKKALKNFNFKTQKVR